MRRLKAGLTEGNHHHGVKETEVKVNQAKVNPNSTVGGATVIVEEVERLRLLTYK